MSPEELKDNLSKYKGYKSVEITELKNVEKCIFNHISDLLRINASEKQKEREKNEKYINEKDSKEEDEIGKELKEMVEMCSNYQKPEMVLYILSKAHEEWIKDNKQMLQRRVVKRPWQFVPFELLEWKETRKYLSVLKPIFNAMDIELDEKELEKEFQRMQIAYLLEKGIHSSESLKKVIQEDKFFFTASNLYKYKNGMTLREMLKKEEIAENISTEVAKRIELNIGKHLKKILLSDANEVGIVSIPDEKEREEIYKFHESLSKKKIGFKKTVGLRNNKPVNKCLFRIANDCGIVFMKNIKKHDYRYFNLTNILSQKPQFIPANQCTSEQKRQIERRKRKVNLFQFRVKNSKSKKYDVPGVVTMVFLKKEDSIGVSLIGNKKLEIKRERNSNAPKIIQIEITKRELAEMGILPSEVGWETKKKALFSSKVESVLFISEADKSTLKKTGSSFWDSVRVEQDESVLREERDFGDFGNTFQNQHDFGDPFQNQHEEL